MKVPYKVKEVKKNVFLLEFQDHYDMCMTFLRYQEFYESPNPKFRGKAFNILDFMKWYSSTFGEGIFTYPKDWDGFNFCDYIVPTLREKLKDKESPDFNGYDEIMYKAWHKCASKANNKPFYIIGTLNGNDDAKEHEVAHAFFYLYPEYKKHMTKLVKELKPETKEKINQELKKLGYTSHVYLDETQAYMSTGLNPSFDSYEKERGPFKEFFKEFLEKTK
jgi:hypothetical protein